MSCCSSASDRTTEAAFLQYSFPDLFDSECSDTEAFDTEAFPTESRMSWASDQKSRRCKKAESQSCKGEREEIRMVLLVEVGAKPSCSQSHFRPACGPFWGCFIDEYERGV